MSERIRVYVLKPKDRATLQLQWVDPVTGRREHKHKTTDPGKAEDKRGRPRVQALPRALPGAEQAGVGSIP